MADMKNTQLRRKGLFETGGLLKLKPWVTVADAARRLSLVLDDEVTEADVFRLALDGNLSLSVFFVNGTTARCGKVIGFEDIEWEEIPKEMAAMVQNLPDKANGTPLSYTLSLAIHDERFLSLSDEVRTIWGVWKLPMIGGERHDIEHQYQRLTGGSAVTVTCLDGAFIEGDDGQICQLLESFDDNEYQSGSSASLERLKKFIAENSIENSKAESLLNKHKEDRKNFLEYQRSRPAKENYYPAGGLPEDAVLVVKTSALMDLEQKHLRDTDDKTMPDLHNAGKWPWGNHETELLRKLAAAAARFYGSNFDPNDIDTAPTNDDVSEWLQAQGISKRLAIVMASILRQDGLRTGRR